MSGTGGQTLHQAVPQPRQADAHRAAHPTQGEALTPQVGHLRTALGSNEAVGGTGAQRALALFAQMLLFAMAGLAMFLGPG